jgi:hypothetical protein
MILWSANKGLNWPKYSLPPTTVFFQRIRFNFILERDGKFCFIQQKKRFVHFKYFTISFFILFSSHKKKIIFTSKNSLSLMMMIATKTTVALKVIQKNEKLDFLQNDFHLLNEAIQPTLKFPLIWFIEYSFEKRLRYYGNWNEVRKKTFFFLGWGIFSNDISIINFNCVQHSPLIFRYSLIRKNIKINRW